MKKRRFLYGFLALTFLLIFVAGYCVGQLPILGNTAEQYRNISDRRQYGPLGLFRDIFYYTGKHIQSQDFLIKELIWKLDQSLNYLCETGAESLFPKEDHLIWVDFLVHYRLICVDKMGAPNDSEEENRLLEIKTDIDAVLFAYGTQLFGEDATIRQSKVVLDKLKSEEGQAAYQVLVDYCIAKYPFNPSAWCLHKNRWEIEEEREN